MPLSANGLFELNAAARASFLALYLLIQRILRVFFFWTLLAKSARLLEEKEFFPFQGKSLNPRKLGPREIFNTHSIENMSHICPAMFTMTMIFNLRAEFLRGLY